MPVVLEGGSNCHSPKLAYLRPGNKSANVADTVVANKFPLKFVVPAVLKVGGVLPE